MSDGDKQLRIAKVIDAKSGYLKIEDENGNVFEREGGTVAWRCNNPGNLKEGKFSKSLGSIGRDYIGHAVFATPEHGEQAQYVLLFSRDGRYYNLTLLDAIARYAPSGDGSNEPFIYARYISQKTDIPLDMKMKNIPLDKRVKMLNIMQVYEGYKIGKDIPVQNTKRKRKSTRKRNYDA